jgi:S1-C subfamily serine protease
MAEAFEDDGGTREGRRPARLIALGVAGAVLFSAGGFAAASKLRDAPSSSSGSPISAIALTKSTASPPASSLAQTVKRVLPSVVNIHSHVFSTDPFGQPQGGTAEASGVILSKDGVILTNNHVVADAARVTVSFTDGVHRRMAGTVVGTDPEHDLAIVKVAATDLSPIGIGSSSKLQLGDQVAAIGFPLGLGGPTVTEGIVSGLARNITVSDGNGTEHLQDLIQTDAAINPGNSGGPLIDANGNLVGIDTAAASASSAENTGFAIPVDQATPVVDQILQQKPEQQAWLGIEVQALTGPIASQLGLPQSARGALIAGIVAGGPAASSGLRRGDVIQSVDASQVTSPAGLTRALAGRSPGQRVTVTISRAGNVVSIGVTLGRRPATLTG